jgi:hypothetical protein
LGKSHLLAKLMKPCPESRTWTGRRSACAHGQIIKAVCRNRTNGLHSM